jgi:hypothetical protein
MNGRVVRFALGITVALAMAATVGFARSSSMHKVKSFNVDLANAVKLNNGEMLKPGDYNMKVAENTKSPQVAFYKDGDLVASTQAHARTITNKNEATELHLQMKGNTYVVNSIDPKGWREKLVFGNSSAQARS